MNKSQYLKGKQPCAAPSESSAGCLHLAFAEIAALQPDATAMICAGQTLSFRELDRLSDRLAQNLNDAGVRPGDIVTVLLPRSLELAVAILGIVKTGGAYAVAGQGWDAEKIQTTCETLNARVAISMTHPDGLTIPVLSVDLSEITPVPVISFVQPLLTGKSPACVFFSSGTTGHAKGVLASHGGIARLYAAGSVLPFPSRPVIPIAANPSWDAFALEFWAPLLLGGTGIMIEQTFLAPDVLRQCVKAHGINCAWLTSSLFNLVMDEDPDALADLDFIMTGGERLSSRHVAAFCRRFPSIQLINGYGPVENTIFTTAHLVRVMDIEMGDIPIGRPVPQTDVFILDGGRECAVGEVGEICTSGAGLALTYLGVSDDRNAGFQVLVSTAGLSIRVYRTGDIGYCDPEGIIHYVGRKDRQVKLRGMRVDTAALEHNIELADPNIGRCRIVPVRNETGEITHLVAFHVSPNPDKPTNIDTLRQRLKGDVCPSLLVPIVSFPYTENGKLDETALLERLQHPGKKQNDEQTKSPAANEIQTVVADIFHDLLGSTADPANDNFFARGGSSLDAARLWARLSRALGTQVSLSDVLGHPSPASLTRHLLNRLPDKPSGSVVATDAVTTEQEALSAVQIGFLVRQLRNPVDTSSHCPLLWRLPILLAPERLRTIIKEIAQNQPALSASFKFGSELSMECREIRGADIHFVYSAANETDARRQVEDYLFQPLDPLSGNLWQVAYAEIPGENASFLGIAVHHIVFDGESEAILAEGLSAALSGYPGPGNYHSPANRKASQLHAPVMGHDESLKMAALAPLDWGPVKRVREAPWLDPIELPCELTSRIGLVSANLGVPQIAVLLAAWRSALLDTTAQPATAVGVPLNLRHSESAGKLVGCGLGVAVVPLQRWSTHSIAGAIQLTSEAFRAALAHTGKLWIPPGPSAVAFTGRHFPYQTLLTLHDAMSRDLDINDQAARFIRPAPRCAVCDLTLDIWRNPGGTWTAQSTFDPHFLGGSTARAVLTRFIASLGEI